MKKSTAIIHIDGGSRGNPGPAACAFTIERDGEPPVEQGELLGETTNNIAEYQGLIRALQKAKELGLSKLEIRGDSQLLVEQMNGNYKVKNAGILPLYQQAQELVRDFSSVTILHIPREQNKRADELCNLALDGGGFAKKKPTSSSTKSQSSKKPASDIKVREECIACIEAACFAWQMRDPDAPTAEDLWDQVWSVLEENGVVK